MPGVFPGGVFAAVVQDHCFTAFPADIAARAFPLRDISYICNHLTAKWSDCFMKSISSIVKGLKAKTEKMLHLQEALQADNAQLKLKVSQLQSRVEELETAKEKLGDQYQTLKLARNVSGDNDKNLAIKLKINELVREIDKCIAQLNR